MKKNIGKKFHLMAMLASLTLIFWGGVTACSNGSDDGGDDKGGDTNGDKITLVENFSLSEITTTLPGVQIAENSKFKELSTSDTITVTITCNSWDTIDNGENSWFQCNFDGKNSDDWDSLIKLADWNTPNVSTTITGDKITALQNGGLYIVGNNKNATVTVSYE